MDEEKRDVMRQRCWIAAFISAEDDAPTSEPFGRTNYALAALAEFDKAFPPSGEKTVPITADEAKGLILVGDQQGYEQGVRDAAEVVHDLWENKTGIKGDHEFLEEKAILALLNPKGQS